MDDMIYITGDTHRDFTRIERFCQRMDTSKDDIIIILGDAGVNYFPGIADDNLKKILSALPVTLFCIHGNHEMRPESLPFYQLVEYKGGHVYVEPEFPSLLFARDGDIFDLAGRSTLVIGGAYSVDKEYRIMHGLGWFSDEQPDEVIRKRTEASLDRVSWCVDTVLSHTVPYKYRPLEVFMPGLDQSSVDDSTERYLDSIEDFLSYDRWFCGHFHTEKKVDRLRIMFEDIDLF